MNLIENIAAVMLNLHNLQCHTLQTTAKKNQVDLEEENAGLKKYPESKKGYSRHWTGLVQSPYRTYDKIFSSSEQGTRRAL